MSHVSSSLRQDPNLPPHTAPIATGVPAREPKRESHYYTSHRNIYVTWLYASHYNMSRVIICVTVFALAPIAISVCIGESPNAWVAVLHGHRIVDVTLVYESHSYIRHVIACVTLFYASHFYPQDTDCHRSTCERANKWDTLLHESDRIMYVKLVYESHYYMSESHSHMSHSTVYTMHHSMRHIILCVTLFYASHSSRRHIILCRTECHFA